MSLPFGIALLLFPFTLSATGLSVPSLQLVHQLLRPSKKGLDCFSFLAWTVLRDLDSHNIIPCLSFLFNTVGVL